MPSRCLVLVALSVGCQSQPASTTDAQTSSDDATALVDASTSGGGKGTGGSTAMCSPSPCTPGTSAARTILANDGSGYMVSFTYAVTRPVGLTNASTNKAPLMIDFFGASTPAFAAANKYVYVFIPQPPQCPLTVPNCGYATRAINANAPSIGLMNACGPPANGGVYGSGTGPCNLKYELKAILDAVIASENIDPDKVFVVGASKGGYATLDAVCDPLTSGYFRGGAVISANVIGSKVAPPATADVNSSNMLCPALTSAPFNKDLSLLFIHGTSLGGGSGQGGLVARWNKLLVLRPAPGPACWREPVARLPWAGGQDELRHRQRECPRELDVRPS